MARITAPAVIVALTAVLAQAQDQPTFRASANYVRVDMYVTVDDAGVEDLDRDEILLLEDGVPQTIEDFEFVRIRPAAVEPSRPEPGTIEESRQMAADARARVFVIFLDTYHTSIEGSATMRLALVKFVDRLLGPDDLVALMTPEMAASDISLTRKASAVSNIMQTEWMWGRRGRLADEDPREILYEACYGPAQSRNSAVSEMKARRREKLTLDALEDLIVHLDGIREERKAIVTVTEGWELFGPNPRLADAGSDRLQPGDVLGRSPRPRPIDVGGMAGATRVECETDRNALAALDHTNRLRQIAEDANRSNVTFYPVYARGLVPSDADPASPSFPIVGDRSASLRVRQDGLRFLAGETDGTVVINTNNIDAAMQRIVDDLSSYYLLGYYSTNAKLDGRFRTISVQVDRPGARVRARRGYRGRTADELLSAAAGGPEASELTAALAPVVGFTSRSPFRIRTSSWHRPSRGGEPSGAFWVVGELDYRTRRELAWTASATADVVVLAANGTEVMSRQTEVRTVEGSFAFEVPETGGLLPGEYALRVRLRSNADEALTLSDTARVVVRDGQQLGEAVLWRRGPTTGLQYRRTADPRFLRSERLRLEAASTLRESGEARLLDRNGSPLPVPVQVTQRADESGEFQWTIVDVTLAPLAVGEYAIELTQGTSRSVTGFRIVP